MSPAPAELEIPPEVDTSRAWAEGFAAGLAPDPRLSIREWADAHRWLSTSVAMEPGQWRTDRTPYLAEIMECLSPGSPIQEVVLMKGAQVGGTEVGLNLIGFSIDLAPGPIMAVWPSLDLAKRYSKQRIEALIEDSPRLRGKVSESRARDSGNTLLAKEFPGGFLLLTGANSAVGLRSMPAKTLLMDDLEGFPPDAGGEGDPVALAEARTRTFRRIRKVLKISTPKRINGRIHKAYLATDRRRYHVPCPECELFQPLKWENVQWEKGRPDTARYACVGCGVLIEESAKTQMLARGKWIAENPDADPTVRGYHIPGLLSPLGWYSWADAAGEFEKTKTEGVIDPELLRAFVNTALGEPWEEQGDAPEWERIFERRESYRVDRVPARAVLLTAGVDVQGDRLEVEVVAWGPGRESWSVAYRVLMGKPEEDDVWRQLDELLAERFDHEVRGSLEIRRAAIDSGHATQEVYAWARRKSPDRVMVVKGRDNFPTGVGQPTAVDVNHGGRKMRRGVKVWPVGVGLLKSELYGWLRLPVPRDGAAVPGYCHFPQYGEEYFRQLTAESLLPKVVRGYRKLVWQKTRTRNEALDCRVYARAAALLLGIDRWKPEKWAELAAALGLAPPSTSEQTRQPEKPDRPPPPRPPPRGGGRGRFMDRWDGR